MSKKITINLNEQNFKDLVQGKVIKGKNVEITLNKDISNLIMVFAVNDAMAIERERELEEFLKMEKGPPVHPDDRPNGSWAMMHHELDLPI